MPLVGSILVIGGARMSGGMIACDRCAAEVTRTWTIRCAFTLCEREHSICGTCLTEIQRFACVSPAAAELRMQVVAKRATPKASERHVFIADAGRPDYCMAGIDLPCAEPRTSPVHTPMARAERGTPKS